MSVFGDGTSEIPKIHVFVVLTIFYYVYIKIVTLFAAFYMKSENMMELYIVRRLICIKKTTLNNVLQKEEKEFENA